MRGAWGAEENAGQADADLDERVRGIVRAELAARGGLAAMRPTGRALVGSYALAVEAPTVPRRAAEAVTGDGGLAAASEVMTVDAVAAFPGVDRNTVYEYAARGTISHRRLGKRVLFHRGALVAWLDPCKAASTRKG